MRTQHYLIYYLNLPGDYLLNLHYLNLPGDYLIYYLNLPLRGAS